MKTKSLSITALFFLIFSIALQADEDVKTVKSKLNEATVFLRGAELTHTASTNLTSGYNEIKIDKLSPSIDKNSLKIRASNGVVISAFEFSVDDVPTKKLNESRIEILEDSIEMITDQLDRLKAEMKIDGELFQIMKKGTDRNVADTLSINDLMKVMEYYQKKSSEIEMRQITNKRQQKVLEGKMAAVKMRLAKESVMEYEKSGVLRISCTAPAVTNCTFSVSYFTPSAQWIPYYDINIVSTDRPIKIISKAKVRQTTTVDWNKVKLTLSTATPSSSKSAPLFSTWFLQYINYEMEKINRLAQNSYSYDVRQEKKDTPKLEEVIVHGYGTAPRSTPVTPLYIVNGNPVDESYYQSIDPSMIKNVEVLKDDEATAIYGSRGASGVILVTLKSTMDEYITTEENDLNLTFNIALAYTVPGDGKEQSIELHTKETSADYKYYCAPKLDRETYLLAEISNWQNLNLLSGKANITYDGTYIGETFINAASTHENLSLTLGTDKRVLVKRELLKDYSSKKTFGKDIEQVITYRMTVKNNQTKTIKMVLKDQYPKSTSKDIKAELLMKETTTPTFNNEAVGILSWEEELKPGETKTYQISYSVRYPEGREVNL